MFVIIVCYILKERALMKKYVLGLMAAFILSGVQQILAVRVLQKGENLEQIINSNKKVIVDFFATWCPPCQKLLPILDELSNEYSDVVIIKVDSDVHKSLVTNFGVRGLPTVILYKDGKIVERFSGYKPKKQLVDLIKTKLQ